MLNSGTVNKAELQMKIGDIVKSLDFRGIDNCYMIGEVVSINFDGTFRAKFMKRVWEGVEDKKFKTDYFTAPLQGEHFLDDELPRVFVIG
ncbi:MAG: hypothetical protein RLZZ196_696 [Bacteroidota bacterium]